MAADTAPSIDLTGTRTDGPTCVLECRLVALAEVN